jgi:amino acid adenylation domain-containing protein
VLLVSPAPDPHALSAALLELARRHEILRTTYAAPERLGAPLMLVSPPEGDLVELAARDVSRLPRAARRQELEALLDEEASRPFDLSRLPLVRALVVTLGAGRAVLAVALPELSADATSVRLLALRALAIAAGAEAAREEPVQYADYAAWRDELAGGDDEAARRAEAFFKKREPGARSQFRMPLEGSGTPAARAARRVLGENAFASLVSTARALGVSPRALLLASVEALLARVSSEREVKEIALRVVCDGRRRGGLQGALGHFERRVPWKRRVDPGDSFGTLARGAQAELDVLDAAEERLTARRKLPQTKVSFAFVEETEPPEGVRVLDPGTSASSGVLRVLARADRRLTLTYATGEDGLDERALARLARAHETLLAAAVRAPSTRVADLPLLDARTRCHVLYDLNRTAVLSHEAPFPVLFEEQAARTPDADAVVSDGERLTYAELNARANRLGRLLRARGVAPGVPVALAFRPSVGQVAALLAVLKAGGAYFPLGLDNPPERLKLLLHGAGVPFVLTDSSLAGLFSRFAETLAVDDAEGLLAKEPASDLPTAAGPEDFVYVIATSGSTGVPKRVAVTHAGLVNYASAIQRFMSELAPGPLRYATVSALSADLGNTCLFPALLDGGAVHLLSHDVATDPAAFASAMRDESIDVLKIVPSHLRALLGSPPDRNVLPRRVLFLGGEALPRELVELVRAVAPALTVVNHYGPTETTVGSLVNVIGNAPLPETDTRTVPIGRPIANTRCYVLDERGEPVFPGVAGELHLGGRGLARGYVGDPEETALRFVPDPFSGEDGARMYRTGDLVRMLGDGSLEFIGRADGQVRVRGHRVELGEVERALVRHRAVSRCAAALVDGRLVAYVVAASGASVDKEALRSFLAKSLPEHMIPAEVVLLDALPLLASGKVDRRALPAPDVGREAAFVEPRAGLEKTVASIWAEVFGVPRLSANADFFELGGHSLIATQILSRIKRATGVPLAPATLFENPSPAALARALEVQGAARA